MTKLDSARPEPSASVDAEVENLAAFAELIAWAERGGDRRVEVVRTEVPEGNKEHEWNVRIEEGGIGWSAHADGCTELSKAASVVLGEARKEGFT